jgi:hypothetical protein
LTTCPPHLHFSLLAALAASSIPLLLLNYSFRILSLRSIPKTFLSILRWHIWIACVCLFVKVHVWLSHMITGMTQVCMASSLNFVLMLLSSSKNLRVQTVLHLGLYCHRFSNYSEYSVPKCSVSPQFILSPNFSNTSSYFLP